MKGSVLDFKYRKPLPNEPAEITNIPVGNISRKRYKRGLLLIGSEAYQIVPSTDIDIELAYERFCICSIELLYYPATHLALAILTPLSNYRPTHYEPVLFQSREG